MRRWSVVAALVLACSSSAPPPPPPPPAPPPNKCAHVADHLLSLLTETAKAAPIEELDRVRAQFKLRCEQDGWSAEAQQCFLELVAKEHVDQCGALLSGAQQRALEAAPAAEAKTR